MKRFLTLTLVLMLVFILAACGGCSGGPGLGDLTEYSGNEAPEESDEEIDEEIDEESSPPIETSAVDSALYADAYLNVLTANSALMTSDDEYMFLGDGKIAVTDVFGNEAPELLYIYISKDNEYGSRLRIMTYSEEEGAVPVFDFLIYAMAGGGGNYCVYLTRGGDLIAYVSMFGEGSYHGFWPIKPMSPDELSYLYDPYNMHFGYENIADALLYYEAYPDFENYDDWVMTFMKDGAEISEDEYNIRAAEIMGDIDRVLFQSSGSTDYGLYDRDALWRDITPFEAESMTYAEAVSWLEARL